tara:strand:+ start:370 stop:747 length:378 start_codon:yes stop_codon:yes gene_type:complete
MYKDYEIKLNAILDKHKGVQKVELGLIDDLEKTIKAVTKFGKEIDTDEKNLKEFLKGVKYWTNSTKTNIEFIEKNIGELRVKMKSVETSSKELDINANNIPAYKEAVDVIKYGQKQINKGKKLLK